MAGISPRTRCSQFKSLGAYNTSRASPELLLTLCFYLTVFKRRTMTLRLEALSQGFGCGCKLCVTLGKSLNASPPHFKAGMRLPPSPPCSALLAPSSEPGMGTGEAVQQGSWFGNREVPLGKQIPQAAAVPAWVPPPCRRPPNRGEERHAYKNPGVLFLGAQGCRSADLAAARSPTFGAAREEETRGGKALSRNKTLCTS